MGVTLRALLQWQQYGVNSPTGRKSGVGKAVQTHHSQPWYQLAARAGKRYFENGKKMDGEW